MANKESNDNILEMTCDIVSAYLSSGNPVEEKAITSLIERIYQTLATIGQGGKASDGVRTLSRPSPAVPVGKSVTPDFIICLEDGKKMKMLRRYLKTAYDMTPDEYRVRWNLPANYPMTAPNYAKQRSRMAKEFGLGKKTAKRK